MNVIVGSTAGFCFGVKRAVEGSLKEIDDNKKIYCLGELVHNKEVIKELAKKGITIINDLKEIKEKNAKVIIRAHGIDKKVYADAKEKDLEIIDFTCPLVARIHNIVEEYKKKNFYIFLVGNKIHPEIIGTVSHCDNNYTIIENENDIDTAINELEKSNLKDLLITVQTTFNKNSFKKIEEVIKEKIASKFNIVVKNTICNTTEERQKETEDISKKVDFMIIIGGKNSSNTKKLYDIAKNNTDSILIETINDINLNDIKRHNKIGIIAGASTPIEIVNEVANTIKSTI